MDGLARGFYLTGTDTGIGKTVASVALLHAFARNGQRATGMKPVASGCTMTNEGWRNDDALALQAASGPAHFYGLHNPFALPEPTAPQIAAADAGISVSLPVIALAYGQMAPCADAMVVEGVGGWLAPLADGLEQAMLASALNLSVIMVVGLRLGCLSHARLTERAILGDGLPIAGWIGNAVEPDFPRAAEYKVLLRSSLASPCLGWLPWNAEPFDPELGARLVLPVALV
ncbi:MAG: dethiobiotin synthase [Gammaproteobacteria bacterium]|nr:dethiobiotin synthase [Gammaproteobacteria bacterium]